ncbi:MAG: DUF2982 domain-containing protein, partial [Pseudoalteromonas tetraodonis]|nr:DUF2982 domain-containing protein [Pseudoalteromonas tetraodonis]
MANINKQILKYRAQGAKNGIEILVVGSIGLIIIML